MIKFEQYVLESSMDQTDRKGDIEKMLQENGVCILGSGVFYVSGVEMPDNTTIMGMGECTEVILAEDVEEGYAISMKSRCTVKNLTLKGVKEDQGIPDAIGTRHGIAFLGDATGVEDSELQSLDGFITDCRIRNFSGGGIFCKDSGYSCDCAMNVTNCRIHFCGVGLYIPHFSEYHKFTNVVCTKNFYGCINNGGNNMFLNCGFDGNTWGYLIDNSDGQARNNAHGSCVGCTFNHSDHNQGVGIKLLNVGPGYVFTGCQVFFSKIVIEESEGIQFANFNFGRNEGISVKGGGVVRFSGCLFGTPPVFELENAPHVKVDDCYTRAGEVVKP